MSEKTDEQKAAEAKAASDAAASGKAEEKAKKIKVRVITDQGEHTINDVIHLSPDDAKAAVASGWADDHPSAVKYAEGLKKHQAAPEAAE